MRSNLKSFWAISFQGFLALVRLATDDTALSHWMNWTRFIRSLFHRSLRLFVHRGMSFLHERHQCLLSTNLVKDLLDHIETLILYLLIQTVLGFWHFFRILGRFLHKIICACHKLVKLHSSLINCLWELFKLLLG